MAKQKELTFDALSRADLGDINITTGVLESIAAKAASEVDGIANSDAQVQKEVGNFLGIDRRRINATVRRHNNGELAIDVEIWVIYGFSVPDVALQVQDRIKEQILFMTDLVVEEVNVHIVSIETDATRSTNYYHIDGNRDGEIIE